MLAERLWVTTEALLDAVTAFTATADSFVGVGVRMMAEERADNPSTFVEGAL
jgi:hypothetical protein